MERNRKGNLPWPIVLLIIAFACAIAYSGALIYTRVSNSSAYTRYRAVELSSFQELEAVSDGFIYYDGSSISKVGTDTEEKWSYMIGADASFDATDYGVATWVGQTLTLIDGKTGTTGFSSKMDGEVLSARIGEHYTAVLVGPEHNSTIVLMETGGRKVDSITLAEQTVVDYGFFSGGSLFWVMTLDTNGTVPSCTISTYKPGKRIVGTISDTEQVMYEVMFQSSQVVCAGKTHLKTYDYTGTEQKDARKLIYGWYLVDGDDDSENPLMAFVPNGQYDGTSQIVDLRMIRGNVDQIVRMPYGCTSLIAKGDCVYGFSNEGVVMKALVGQQVVQAYQLPVRIDNVYGVANGDVAIVGYGNIIYFVSLT